MLVLFNMALFVPGYEVVVGHGPLQERRKCQHPSYTECEQGYRCINCMSRFGFCTQCVKKFALITLDKNRGMCGRCANKHSPPNADDPDGYRLFRSVNMDIEEEVPAMDWEELRLTVRLFASNYRM